MQSMLMPAAVFACVLIGLNRRVNVYEAFVYGAKEALSTLAGIAPYMAAILICTRLLRSSGAMAAAQALLGPLFRWAGVPAEAAGVILLRPLSGSAAMGLAGEVMADCGPDSRAGLLACVICGAGETIFFTGAMYMGAAGLRRAPGAIPAALTAYAAGVLAAALLV